MRNNRFIPVLLIKDRNLVKTNRYANPQYIGDPINAVRIFNEKCVDELIILDVSPTRFEKGPDFEFINEIASEAFIPIAYGGGISTVGQVEKIIRSGVEKVVFNSAVIENPATILAAAAQFGNQAIVGSLDLKKNILGGYRPYINSGKKRLSVSVNDCTKQMIDLGVGEIIVNCIDREGAMTGYDIPLINSISSTVNVPVIASCGARDISDLKAAITNAGASAAAAGSMFVFYGRKRAVLISYPSDI